MGLSLMEVFTIVKGRGKGMSPEPSTPSQIFQKVGTWYGLIDVMHTLMKG